MESRSVLSLLPARPPSFHSKHPPSIALVLAILLAIGTAIVLVLALVLELASALATARARSLALPQHPGDADGREL